MADVIIPQEEVDSISARFDNSLYGYFVRKKPAFPAVQNYVKHAWAKFGFKHVMVHQGFFMFQFTTKDGMEKVLNHGPWRIRSVPLMLHVWNPNSELKREVISKIPVWVKMFNVPVVAYSKVGLDLITSKLGRLIMLDAHTSNMCLNSWGMNSYARALVEISADKDFVESLVVAIPVKGKEHRMVSIDIDFEWRPPRCSLCKIFDHMDVECHKKGNKVNSKANMDDESVHIKRTTKGTNQGSTSKYKAGFKFPKGKPILVYRPVAKTNVTSEKASIRPTNATSIIQDEIDLDQLRNNMNKLMEEEKVLDINTEVVTSGLDDGIAVENGILGEEVFAFNDEFEAYLSSVGGGNQLEEEFDFYDDDYEDQIRDLPSVP
ncbi:zinc knuckle CX2CX4HX4C containing protein [Tanacetum coccineum]